MRTANKCALSIAGFDPSGGAGLLADAKVFEVLGACGLAACTAITYQTDREFVGLRWLEDQEVVDQLSPLLERFSPATVKIGLVRDLQMLAEVVGLLRDWGTQTGSQPFIVWDPVVQSSTGFSFHDQLGNQEIVSILRDLNLITPNRDEACHLASDPVWSSATEKLSRECATLITGGHAQGALCQDLLYMNGKESASFTVNRVHNQEKHGSGCVHSAALVAFLAEGMSLQVACKAAQEYAASFIESSDDLMGWHRKPDLAELKLLSLIT